MNWTHLLSVLVPLINKWTEPVIILLFVKKKIFWSFYSIFNWFTNCSLAENDTNLIWHAFIGEMIENLRVDFLGVVMKLYNWRGSDIYWLISQRGKAGRKSHRVWLVFKHAEPTLGFLIKIDDILFLSNKNT